MKALYIKMWPGQTIFFPLNIPETFENPYGAILQWGTRQIAPTLLCLDNTDIEFFNRCMIRCFDSDRNYLTGFRRFNHAIDP